MKVILTFCLALNLNFIALSQVDNYWNIIDSGAFTFKLNSINIKSNKLMGLGSSASICNSQGNPLLYTDGQVIKDGNNKNIISSPTEYSWQCLLSSVLIPVEEATFYLIQEYDSTIGTNGQSCMHGLNYTVIKRDNNNQYYIDNKIKNKILKQGKPSYWSGTSACRNKDGSFYVNSVINDTLLIYSLDSNFTLKSSVSLIPFYQFAAYPPQINTRYSNKVKPFFNHLGNKLYVEITEDLILTKYLTFNIGSLGLPIQHEIKILSFDFDKVNGLLSNPQVLWKQSKGFVNISNIKPQDTLEVMNFVDFSIPTFSLDDELLYINLSKGEYIIPFGRPYSVPADSSILIQINVNTGATYSFNSLIEKSGGYQPGFIKQLADGRISKFIYKHINSDTYFNSDVIQFPNGNGQLCNYQKDFLSIKLSKNMESHQVNMYHYFDYIRLKYNITYDCKANIQFTNNSFSEAKFNDYTWYINKLNGKTDTLKGATPSIVIEISGKYPYKVFGHSTAKLYGEWFYDTLFVTIPEKPVANFKAVDTVICRYLPLQFKNQSSTKEIKPGSLATYVWTFGDGSPSNNDFEPTHIYTKPGIYTVSLFYSNGYCDSTLVKNQYIRVVDAPKAGFTVINKQGCSPFMANFTDTVTLNVTKKEYWFSDSAKWKAISTLKFDYTFQKPGHYWAVQKLYGFTGCVIKTDSIQFFISKGLLTTDSIAITLASYDTLNHLHLEWKNHPAATSYNVYRSEDGSNFSLLTNTTQTNCTDIGIFKTPNYYKILAMDSCDKVSSAKNSVKPQWIRGERLSANEASILTYTPDEGLGFPESLELEWTNRNAINLSLGETNPVNPYRDENFAQPGFLKKCYRYTANHNGGKMYSNYECIDFEPQTFVPNSFTPNGDGLNDKFLPSMMGIVSYDMKVFNRWGQLVYSGNTPWDGMINGQAAEADVFMYSIHIMRNDRNSEFYKGMVHLIR